MFPIKNLNYQIFTYLISGEIIFSETVSARSVVPLVQLPPANWEHFSSSLVSFRESRSPISRWNKIPTHFISQNSLSKFSCLQQRNTRSHVKWNMIGNIWHTSVGTDIYLYTLCVLMVILCTNKYLISRVLTQIFLYFVKKNKSVSNALTNIYQTIIIWTFSIFHPCIICYFVPTKLNLYLRNCISLSTVEFIKTNI